MKPFSFADVLFLFLTLLITFTILWLVNKAKGKRSETKEDTQGKTTSDVNEK